MRKACGRSIWQRGSAKQRTKLLGQDVWGCKRLLTSKGLVCMQAHNGLIIQPRVPTVPTRRYPRIDTQEPTWLHLAGHQFGRGPSTKTVQIRTLPASSSQTTQTTSYHTKHQTLRRRIARSAGLATNRYFRSHSAVPRLRDFVQLAYN